MFNRPATSAGLLHLFDTHVACQDFFRHLLNAIYDLQLEVTDRIKADTI
jgi:hypothetical protein